MYTIKGRGAISNPSGRFEKTSREAFIDDWHSEEVAPSLDTILLLDNAKSIISHNDSPDLGFEQSINPYRGCEHGCIYCYARPSHSYMNMSAGLDFETKIFYKPKAAELLEKELNKPSYICKPIVLGANTDPYQPVEKQLKITRSILEILNQYHHPVIVITKGKLIERDLDLLGAMASRNLAKVAISLTTLSAELKQILEPRAASPQARLKVIADLNSAQIPIRVMVAPIIPMINDGELEKILETAKKAGARQASYVLVRLPHEVKELFKEWLAKHFPDRAEHVMSLIRQMRGGKEYDARFGKRMHGEGEFAQLIAQRFLIACKRFGMNETTKNNLDLHSFKKKPSIRQLTLFD